MSHDEHTPTRLCQAEDCSDTPEYVCEAWIMTPPDVGFEKGELFLCSDHATQFENGVDLTVQMDPENADLLSAATYRY